jgi:hypothetical protein
MLAIKYHMLFRHQGLVGYLQLARDTLHATEERVV